MNNIEMKSFGFKVFLIGSLKVLPLSPLMVFSLKLFFLKPPFPHS